MTAVMLARARAVRPAAPTWAAIRETPACHPGRRRPRSIGMLILTASKGGCTGGAGSVSSAPTRSSIGTRTDAPPGIDPEKLP